MAKEPDCVTCRWWLPCSQKCSLSFCSYWYSDTMEDQIEAANEVLRPKENK